MQSVVTLGGCALLVLSLFLTLQSGHGFSLQQYDRSVPSRDVRADDSKWKTGPSHNSWYYMMGHPSQKRSFDFNSVHEQGAALGRRQTDDIMGISLMGDFMTYLTLKENGLLDECIALARRVPSDTDDKKKKR